MTISFKKTGEWCLPPRQSTKRHFATPVTWCVAASLPDRSSAIPVVIPATGPARNKSITLYRLRTPTLLKMFPK